MVQEVECVEYYGIPDYILDGIHPEKDMDGPEDNVEVDQAVTTIFADVNDTNGREVKRILNRKSQNVCRNDELDPSLKINKVTRFLLTYANHHISSIFIIVLSITSLILSMHASIGITAAILIVIVAIDVHFTVGIGTI
jgi:hypothetical protein